MRVPAPVIAVLMLAAGLAGCLSGAETESVTPPVRPPPFVFDVSNLPLPGGESARGFIESFIMTHPFRRDTSPPTAYKAQARDDIETLLQGFGLDVDRQDYGTGVNLLGMQEGVVHPDEWVVLSAHYDSTRETVYGAWDNGAGVSALLELARTLAPVEFPFTLVYAFFDEEELGLFGSLGFVKNVTKRHVDVLADINLDPPGLNWPCGDASGPYPVTMSVNSNKAETMPRYRWFLDAVHHGLNETQVPIEHRQWHGLVVPIYTVAGGGLGGTSDHAALDAADIPAMNLGGLPVISAGPVTALNYAPVHTPIDTLPVLDSFCLGGAKDLAAGMQAIMRTATHALAYLATTPEPSG